MIPGLNNNFGRKNIYDILNKSECLLLIIDIWPWSMDSPLSDDPNGEHYDLNALINDQVRQIFISIKSNFGF
jgi:hypothetical protein